MKNSYFLGLLTLLFASNVFCQDVITGGNMDDESKWTVSLLNTDPDNTTSYEFNHTTITPSEGEGGCLYISGTNTGIANGNLTNIIFYQQVTLQRGTTYSFDGAYKDARTNNFWFEVYVGGNEPEVGSDYGTDQGAIFISGYKSTNWETECPTDEFDGTIQNDACSPGTTNSVLFEGEGDTTVYFGFRTGIWDDSGSGYTFEVYVDNISLTAASSTSISKQTAEKLAISPNPFKNQITISSETLIRDISIVNNIGQLIYHQSNLQTQNQILDLTTVLPGIYQIIITDQSGKIIVRKAVKL